MDRLDLTYTLSHHIQNNYRAVIELFLFFQIYYDEDNVATLIIREVFPEDAGKFTCVAKNAAGFASSTTELIVEAPISDHGSDTTVSISRKSLSR
jgi:hypothetical protein